MTSFSEETKGEAPVDPQCPPDLVSVVVPVYNEHQTVSQVVTNLLQLEIISEVIVVDDGSNELTQRALRQLSTSRRVRVLRHPLNCGKGAALRSGFAVCTGRVVVIQDADLEYPVNAIPEVVRPILDGDADVVYGSRELGCQYRGASWVRRVANRSLTWLSNRLTGLRLTDMETGCKAFGRVFLDCLTIEEDRFGVEPELTAKAAAAGCRIVETPICYQPRSYQEGKKIGCRDGVWALWCIARYSLRKSSGSISYGDSSLAHENQRLARVSRTAVSAPATSQSSGFTLVEIIVVIAIVGVLVAISLPAVQMARESARRASCSNKLKQIAIAVELHEQSHGAYPTGGWGADWVGDPDAGYGLRQPGGWIYNILPYVGEASLREVGVGLVAEEKSLALKELLATPLASLACPSRRLAQPLPYNGAQPLRNAEVPGGVAKTDYVVNSKLSSLRSEVIVSEIQLQRGLSRTVLVGEKSLRDHDYLTGSGNGDRLTAYQGHSSDISRDVTGAPWSDRQSSGSGYGSAHAAGCHFAYCDGAVKLVNYNQEP